MYTNCQNVMHLLQNIIFLNDCYNFINMSARSLNDCIYNLKKRMYYLSFKNNNTLLLTYIIIKDQLIFILIFLLSGIFFSNGCLWIIFDVYVHCAVLFL